MKPWNDMTIEERRAVRDATPKSHRPWLGYEWSEKEHPYRIEAVALVKRLEASVVGSVAVLNGQIIETDETMVGLSAQATETESLECMRALLLRRIAALWGFEIEVTKWPTPIERGPKTPLAALMTNIGCPPEMLPENFHCSRCGAEPGRPCTTPSGKLFEGPDGNPHAPRMDKAIKALHRWQAKNAPGFPSGRRSPG